MFAIARKCDMINATSNKKGAWEDWEQVKELVMLANKKA